VREYRLGDDNNNPRRAAEWPAPDIMNIMMVSADYLSRRSLRPPARVSGCQGVDVNNQLQKAEDSIVVSRGVKSASACVFGWRLTWNGLAPMALLAVMIPLALCASADAAPQVAQAADVIQTQDANTDGIVAEITECRRSEGVLTIKIRFRNNSEKPGTLTFTHWNAAGQDNPKFYVTAGNKKYFMLADSDGTVLSTNSTGNGVDASIAPGKTYLWWAKYPAPPADVKKINFMMPVASPFDDVPITDK
jgi:hypothetical protein